MIINPLATWKSGKVGVFKPQKSTNIINQGSFFSQEPVYQHTSLHTTGVLHDHFRWYTFEWMHLLKCRLEVKSFCFSLGIKVSL